MCNLSAGSDVQRISLIELDQNEPSSSTQCPLQAVGVSGGAACALQMALRHPDRVSALVLVAPIAWKPDSIADSAPHVPDGKDEWLLRLLGSDFLYWAGLQAARDQVLRHVLATSPELIHAASAQEQARVNAMAERVLPVSQRARLLLDDVTVTFAQAIPEPSTAAVLLLWEVAHCLLFETQDRA